MPIRLKMFLLVAVVLGLATGGIFFITSGTFRDDKEVFVREFNDKFTATVAKLVTERVITYENYIATFVSNRQSLVSLGQQQGVVNLLFERFPDFHVISTLSHTPTGWAPDWIERNPKKASEWPKGFELTLLKSVNLDESSKDSVSFVRVSDPTGKPLFALSFSADVQAEGNASAKKALLFGVLREDAFDALIKDFKGNITSVFVVDRKGFVYAHPETKWIGTALDGFSMVQDIKTSNRAETTGKFTDTEGNPILGSYRQAGSTNLFVVAFTPLKEAMRAADELILFILVAAIGLVVVGLVLVAFLSAKITNPLQQLQAIAAQIGAGNFKIPVKIESNDEVGKLAKSIDQMKTSLLERDEALDQSKSALIQSEKMSAFGQLSAGIAHEVKNPLAGILGHAQLAKGKTGDPDLLKHIEVIEKETRRTKEIIENLMKFARAEKTQLQPTDLYETVSATLDLVDHQLSLMGVKVHKKLNSVPPVMGNSNQLQQVLLNIMMNAGHAMEKTPQKNITVYLEGVEKLVRIRIEDTGTGMSPEIQKRIFEPFFTTKAAGKGTGLGLSVSIGIVRDHNGKIYVKSEVGHGTTFFVDLPATNEKLVSNTNLRGAAEATMPSPKAESPTQPPVETMRDYLTETFKKPLSVTQVTQVTQSTPSAKLGPELKQKLVKNDLPTDLPVPPPIDDRPKSADERLAEIVGKGPSQSSNDGQSQNAEPDQDAAGFRVTIRRPKLKG